MIVDGKKIAQRILEETAKKVNKLHRSLVLAAILVGPSTSSRQAPSTNSGQGSRKFLELKKKAGEKIGLATEILEFSDDLMEGVLRSRIKETAGQSRYDGVLIELPLPRAYQTQNILDAIPPEKDVDVLSSAAQKKFFSGDFSILPPAVAAVEEIFTEYKINPKNKKVAVFGQGILVGKPLAYWLYQKGARVSVVNEFTKNPAQYSKEADILISGTGKAKLITGEMVKNGVIVIDFGYNTFESEVGGEKPARWAGGSAVALAGDVDFETVALRASLITPVPGGVGPIVIAAVLRNLTILAEGN